MRKILTSTTAVFCFALVGVFGCDSTGGVETSSPEGEDAQAEMEREMEQMQQEMEQMQPQRGR